MWFLLEKRFSSVHDLKITNDMCVRIAVKACLPILELGIDCYGNFKGIVLYPEEFRVPEQHVDEVGVVHEHIGELCGQSSAQGPMVLSWGTIETEDSQDGHDLVIHECAHMLDTLNGDANGFPPLHASMTTRAWSDAFHTAYDKFCVMVDAEEPTQLDPYAAEDPAEFFAVASETFFTRPDILIQEFSEVYRQLAAFYKQDPYRDDTTR